MSLSHSNHDPVPVNLVLFHNNLRLTDNLALNQAAQNKLPILPALIYDREPPMGEASRWWLHHSLAALGQTGPLAGSLNHYRGDHRAVIADLASRYRIAGIYWQEHFSDLDTQIADIARLHSIIPQSCPGQLLWDPRQVIRPNGDYYKVFTHFYRAGCLKSAPPTLPQPTIPEFTAVKDTTAAALPLAQLDLLPQNNWSGKFNNLWEIGEVAAQKNLSNFLQHRLSGYKEQRDYPHAAATSRLSPHLRFGEISPQQVWHAVHQQQQHPQLQQNNTAAAADHQHFLSEIAWREFSYYLQHHFPALGTSNFTPKFDRFPWINDPEKLNKWRRGQTGFPLVDAGMRQLWDTGYMHNRVRMVVGSFLVKNLLIDWRAGAEWFMDCLVDADPANNSASWQWVAGSGADAAPYFRIFNPILQGEKFDPEGLYIKTYVPELRSLSAPLVHRPWLAPHLAPHYPPPLVDLSVTRQQALAAYKTLG